MTEEIVIKGAEEINSNGHFKIAKLTLEQIFKNSTKATLVREVISRAEHDEAVHVFIHDPKNKLVCLVKQFRAAHILEESAFPIELVAGMIDRGESPVDAAIREALEETGLAIKNVKKLNKKPLFMCPGMTVEKTNIITAEADLSKVQQFGGAKDEGEETEILVVSFERLQGMVDHGEIKDVPSLLAISMFNNLK